MTTRGKWLDHCLHKNRNSSKYKRDADAIDVSRSFQVCVNILEGKKLAFAYPSSATSYVMVALDKVKYRSSVRQNMRVPYYRENFVFELFTSTTELKRKCVWLTVMEPCCGVPRVLGEAVVDLAHVWRQPRHTITHKWVQLTLPNDPKSDPVGYLKLDMSISTRAEVLDRTDIQHRIDEILLMPHGSEQQPACYQVTVYRAYCIPCTTGTRPDTRGNPPSTCLKISYCDLLGETTPKYRTNNPVYAERVLIVEMFPNTCDTILFEVCSVSPGSKVLASTRLKLSEISHGGENGFLPTYGPSLLHMYGPWNSDSSEDGPFHRGALVVTMKAVVPYYKQGLRTVQVEPLSASLQDTEWIIENFIVFCPIFEVSMMDTSVSDASCGVAITAGEIVFTTAIDQDSDEFDSLLSETKKKKLHYTGGRCVRWNSHVCGHLDIESCPVLQLATRLPDFRFRIYMNNVILGIVTDLESELRDTSSRLAKNDYGHPNDLLECLRRSNDDAAAKIKRFLEIVKHSSSNEDLQKYNTELDQKLVQMQKEKIEKLYCQIMLKKPTTSYMPAHTDKCGLYEPIEAKKTVKIMLAESRTMVQELKELVYMSPDGWPKMSVWLLSNGSRVAYAKMEPSDVIHSSTPEQCGRRCGKIQTVYLKPIKCSVHHPMDCHCIAGKVELLAWMGAFRQRSGFQHYVPEGFRRSETGFGIECEPMNLECCVNVYRAKLVGTCDAITVLSPFVRVHFVNNVKDTQVCQNTSFPVWSEVLRICCCANVTHERLEESPPEILVELYHWDATQRGKIDLLGRATVTPMYLVAHDLESPPCLEWLDVHLGTEQVGMIQMSAQVMQVKENTLSKAWINRSSELRQRSSEQVGRTVLTSDIPEPLPLHILPANTTYKIDVYFWGLRDIGVINKPLVTLELEDVIIKSGIIAKGKPNCNFPNARISQTFQGNLTNGSSSLTVKLFDTTTFGRTLFAGLNVKNPQKYLLTWIPRREREETLFSKPVVSSVFTQINRKTFVKKSLTAPVPEHPKPTTLMKNEKNTRIRVKCFFEKMLAKKTCEEKIMLLPVYTKERDSMVKETEDDWWTRYYAALNAKSSGDRDLAGNRITIYDSELEEQPDFNRFKDWCSTIKIYNGNKTGIPEEDEKLRCGYLKASIAIYQWPPPAETVAVSNNGVDLERGYFDGISDNDPARYLVRVYAIKCSGLVAKGFTAASRCYVAIQSNSKKLGDRESSVLREAEPVFGRMFELDCTLPDDYLLRISVMDCSPAGDELIGSTSIDLEDRVYTKHRATVGLAAEYNINGPNRWRDCERPSAILEQLCEQNHLPPPEFPDPTTLALNGVEYKDLDSGPKYTSPLASKENLCLSILHKWHTMPVCGHRLVPEHVEVRTLYDPDNPGVEQGKIHMWLDMFPLDSRRAIPAPALIRPRPEEYYELRLVVWDVQDLSISKSNIYVRAWIGPSDEAQDTDIYTSVNGEGHFNWRMIFQFQYKHTERKLLVHDKGPFTEVTELFPPILVIQVLDIDAPTLQDFLGILTLDLSSMPRGARTSDCAHAIMGMRKINMFTARNARGWWPLRMVDRNSGDYYFAGTIELEISLLPKEKAIVMPVGIGRDPPAPLPDPIREPQLSRSKSDSSLIHCSPATRLLIVIGLLLLGFCLYWQLPVIVFSVIRPSSM